ncbi:hypothetical protein ACQP08_21315 [Micromonospora zamorensis]
MTGKRQPHARRVDIDDSCDESATHLDDLRKDITAIGYPIAAT